MAGFTFSGEVRTVSDTVRANLFNAIAATQAPSPFIGDSDGDGGFTPVSLKITGVDAKQFVAGNTEYKPYAVFTTNLGDDACISVKSLQRKALQSEGAPLVHTGTFNTWVSECFRTNRTCTIGAVLEAILHAVDGVELRSRATLYNAVGRDGKTVYPATFLDFDFVGPVPAVVNAEAAEEAAPEEDRQSSPRKSRRSAAN